MLHLTRRKRWWYALLRHGLEHRRLLRRMLHRLRLLLRARHLRVLLLNARILREGLRVVIPAHRRAHQGSHGFHRRRRMFLLPL